MYEVEKNLGDILDHLGNKIKGCPVDQLYWIGYSEKVHSLPYEQGMT